MNSSERNPSKQEPKREFYCPSGIRGVDQWTCWQYVQKSGQDKPSKVPCTPTGRWSGCDRAEDYLSFDHAAAASYDAGFCFTNNDPYIGIDLDHVVAPETGEIHAEWAKSIVESLKGKVYMELSPGGDGIHIIGMGRKPEGMKSQTVFEDGTGIEVYDRGRFFTFTGEPIAASGDDVADVQHTVDWLAREPFFQLGSSPSPSPTAMVQASVSASGGGGSTVEKRAQAYADAIPSAHQLTRNNACFKLAGNLLAFPGIDTSTVQRLVLDFAGRCVPPFSPEEARECVASALKKNGTPPAPKEDRPLPEITFTAEQDAAFFEFSEWSLTHRIVDGRTVEIANAMSQPKGAANDLGWTPSAEFLDQFGLDFSHPQLAEFIEVLLEGGAISLRGSGRPRKYIFEAPDPEKGFHEDFAKWTSSILPLERSPVERLQQYPAMKPVIIDGLLRETEILNVIAAPKVGKSWFALQMAVSVALGIDFLGRPTQQQKVFILDNELHPETAVDRLELMCTKMGISPADLEGKLVVDNLRGSLTPLDELVDYFLELQGYGLIVLDALYRLLPRGISENDNAAMTEVYNMLDRYAASTNAAICCIHHTSKGDQSAKSTTDIGSGAGSQSRAADSHLTMLPHEIEDCVVLGGVVRSFSGFAHLTLKREFPTWIEKPMIAAEVKKPEAAKAKVDTNERDEAVFQILKKVGKPSTANQIYEHKGSASVGKASISASLADLAEQGDVTVEESEVKGRTRSLYSLQPSALNHETLADYRSEKWDIQC